MIFWSCAICQHKNNTWWCPCFFPYSLQYHLPYICFVCQLPFYRASASFLNTPPSWSCWTEPTNYGEKSGSCWFLTSATNHQKFHVPKVEVLNPIRLFLGVCFPLHRPYPYSLYRWGFLHFRYLKCLVSPRRDMRMVTHGGDDVGRSNLERRFVVFFPTFDILKGDPTLRRHTPKVKWNPKKSLQKRCGCGKFDYPMIFLEAIW